MIRILMFVAYWALAITQFLGIYAYFSDVLDWNGFISLIFAILLASIPVIGTVIGVMGAVQGWGWDLIPALCLYLWPFIVFALLAFVGGIRR